MILWVVLFIEMNILYSSTLPVFFMQSRLRRAQGSYLEAQNRLLAKAAKIGHISQARRAISNGADVDGCIDDKYRDSVLYTAIRNGHVPMVKLLLQAGANPNVVDKDMLTPFYWAVTMGSIPIARLLYQAGADLNALDKYNRTLLHNAALFGQTKVAKLLLEEYGVHYAEAKDRWGDTALHKACHRGHVEVVQYLLQNGSISPISLNNRHKRAVDEISLTHPNRPIIIQMFENLSFVRMQPMDIDINIEQDERHNELEEDDSMSEEEEEEEIDGRREDSEEDEVEMEDFQIEDDRANTSCCKSCAVL